jgi:hypothetical protein
MATRTTLSTRWVTVIMVAALLCSVAVVWGLIQITGQSPASSSTPAVSPAASVPAQSSTSPTPPSGSAPPTAPPTSGPSASPNPASPVSTALATTTALPALPGSGLLLPAAWTGTAEMTITVLGRCASEGGTSSYTRTAELALQGPASGSGPVDDPNPLSMTLGITPAEVPGLSIYSATTDRSGGVRRTWWVATGAETGPEGQGRTTLSGVLIDDQPFRGILPPNLLVDNETDLQPCESGGTVRVPRTLAAGSTVRGWVSATAGHLELIGTTADGERAVTAVVELTRRSAA